MQRTQGLSLIEVLTALAIAVVLLAMALPACLAAIDRARIARVQADLGDAFLSGARLAVASGTATVLCPARETGGCTGAKSTKFSGARVPTVTPCRVTSSSA